MSSTQETVDSTAKGAPIRFWRTTGTLTIRVALQRIRHQGLTLVEPKSARSHRTIVLPEVAASALKAHRVRQLEGRMLAGARWQDTGFVFTTRDGAPVDPRNATRHFHKMLREAGLPAVRFHDLRHTAATLLHAQGVDARTIMQILGHSQISLTLNTYTHVLPALQQDAARQMDRALRG